MSWSPLRLSKMRTKPTCTEVTICSPCGENLTPVTSWPCSSGPTSLFPVAVLQILAFVSPHPVPVANLVESGETSTADTSFSPSTSISFSCISASHMLAPPLAPQTIHLPSLDTEMARNLIPVCFPTSRPSASRHCRIPASPPPKICFPSGWNTTAITTPE